MRGKSKYKAKIFALADGKYLSAIGLASFLKNAALARLKLRAV
jgi:hypothetical protein